MSIKIFSSKESMIIILAIVIVGFLIFLFAQNKIVDIEKEAIKKEERVRKETELLLFQLKETLQSGHSAELIKTESLSILSKIRQNLSNEYLFLGSGAQRGVDEIRIRLDFIEEAIQKEDFQTAIKLTEELIGAIQKIERLEDITDLQNNNQTNSDPKTNLYNHTPNYSENDDQNLNEQNTDSSSDNTNDTTDTPTNTEDQNIVEEIPTQTPTKYYPGKTPEVDRDRSSEIEGVDTPIKTKIGD